MTLINFMKKLIKVSERMVIKQLAHIDGNLYTKYYTKHLRKYGMDIDGLPRYIATTALFDGNDYSIIHIGKGSVISSEVQLLTHDYSIARGLQAIGKNNLYENRDELFLKGIYIGENSFIGARSTILPDTHIGDNVIVGAGSVVKGNVPDNSIIMGNPAKFYTKTTDWAKKKYQEHDYIIEE